MAKQMSQNQPQDAAALPQGKAQTAKPIDNTRISGIAGMLFTVMMLMMTFGAIFMEGRVSDFIIGVWSVFWLLLGTYLLFAIKVAKQWEKAVVLRLGRFRGLKGPGLFWIVPIIDATPVWIDHRVMVTPFNAEKTLTRDATQLFAFPR